MNPYSRRSGGISKTLVLADFVTLVVAPAIGLLVEAGVWTGTHAAVAVAFVGIVTRFLRTVGPKPKR